MKVLTVVGARPNFMKAAPIITAIQKHNASLAKHDSTLRIDHVLAHTGQHYDARMSDPFFADLQIPDPDIQLGVGSGSHNQQTAEILRKFEDVLLKQRPDVVIVVGDVNSTVACALATAKISFDAHGTRPILAHVEAGLRSYDRAMPEEINRVVTDHVSDLLFVTEPSGQKNLLAEGISPDTIFFAGNTMIDSLLTSQDKADVSPILDRLGLRRNTTDGNVTEYGLLTLHRPSNVDNPETFLRILAGLDELAAAHPVVFPVHPRTKQRILEFGLKGKLQAQIRSENGITTHSQNGLVMTEPLGYLDFLCLMKNAAVVVTDSGGIQEETTCLGVPCVTVRENTERPVTVDVGTNVIAGTSTQRIRSAIRESFGRESKGRMPGRWDGHAAERIVERLVEAFIEKTQPAEPVGSHA